jgi:hypothetical protein
MQEDDGVDPHGRAQRNQRGGTTVISSTIQPATKDETSKSLTRNRRGCKNGVVAKAADVPTIKPSTTGHPIFERISRRTCVRLAPSATRSPTRGCALPTCTEHAEYAHARQKNRNEREQAQREHAKFRAGELRREQVVDRGCLGHGFGRVDLLERLLSDG